MSFFARVSSRLKTRLLTRRQAILLSVLLVFGLAIALGVHAGQDAGSTTDGLNLPGKTVIDYMLAILGMAFSALAWGIGKLIILVIGMVIIPILGYNGFGGSQVVSIGWALVRDVVNMFVIVLLLLMAVQTMLGVGRIDWRQQLPRFFLAVVAVNFSKTITLFLIDIGQVVMFTFVNALTDIAAGNFINLLQISSFYELSEAANQVDGVVQAGGYNAVGFLATSWLTVSLLGMVLAVMLMMALIFVYRIVLLWVLIVVSPIAFFAGGVGNTVASFGGQYADWWKRLVGAVALGPILTFFLWLALASASSGGIATSEGFNTNPTDDAVAASGPYTQIFELDRFLSLILALVLITVGFQAASAQAQAIGGPAASLISEGTGQRLLKGAVAAPGALAYGGARLGYRGARKTATGAIKLAESAALPRKPGEKISRFAPSEVAAGLGRRGAEVHRALGNIPLVGDRLGRAVAAPFYAAEAKGAAFKAEEFKAAEETLAGYSDSNLDVVQRNIEEGRKPPIGQEMVYAAAMRAYGGDKGVQKKRRKALEKEYEPQYAHVADEDERKKLVGEAVQKRLDAGIKRSLEYIEANKDNLIGDDEKKKTAFFKAKSANLHLLYQDLSDEARQKKIEEHVQDEDFKVSQLSADAVRDSMVEAALKTKSMGSFMNTKTGERETISAWDYVKRGQAGTSAEARDAASEIDEKEGLIQDFTKTAPVEMAKRIKDGVMDVKKITVSDLDAPKGKDAAGRDITAMDDIMAGLRQAVAQGSDISGLNEDVKARLLAKVGDYSGIENPTERAATRQMMFSMTKDASHLGVGEGGKIDFGRRGDVNVAISSDPTVVNNIISRETSPEGMILPPEASDATNESIRAVKPSDFQKLANEFRTASDDRRREIRSAFETWRAALDAENGRGDKDKQKIDKKQLTSIERSINSANRLIS